MKSKLFFISLLFLVSNAFAQVAINTDGSAADASAMLDVKSNTAGILIPRMTASQRDAITNPTPGLMVFVTTDSTFYFYKNSGWQQVGNGASYWHTGNGSVFTDSLVGIGTTTTNATLDIYNSNRDTTIMISLYNNDNEVQYALLNEIAGTGDGDKYGVFNYTLPTSGGSQFGVFNVLKGFDTGNKCGVYNYTSPASGGWQYGVFNDLNGSGTSSKYGVYNSIPDTAGGTHYGTYNDVQGLSNYAGYFLGRMYVSDNVGFGTASPVASLEITNSSNDTTFKNVTTNNDSNDHYGLFNSLTSSGSGEQYGIYNNLDVSSATINHVYAIKNYIEDSSATYSGINTIGNYIYGSGDGIQTGIYQFINNSGDGGHYGLYNTLGGTGSGEKYGVYNQTTSTSGGRQFGVYSFLQGSDSYKKYGVYNSIPETAGGTHYGTYNDVQGSSNYAGYFLGRLYASDKAGFGTANPAASLEISNGTNDTTLKIVTTNNNSNEHYGLFNSLTSSGANKQYGIYNSLSLSGSGTGSVRGIFNGITDYGTGSRTIKLERAYIDGSGDGTQWGIDLAISNTGNGTHEGIGVTLNGTGTGHKTGVGITIPTTAGGTHYGIWSEAEGSSNYAGYFLGRLYASDKAGFGTTSPTASLEISNSTNDTTLMVSSTNSNSDRHFGILNYISNSGTGEQYGIYNQLNVSGTTTNPVYASENYVEDFSTSNKEITAVRNSILGSSNGAQYGVYQQILNTGNGAHYGLDNYLNGTGSGQKYGIRNFIPSSAGGTHFGTFNDVQGSSNYAGYFIGRMYVSDKVGFGTTSPHELLEVAGSSGSQGRMVVSDGGGSNRYGLLLVSPNSTTNGRIETYLYGAEQGQTLEVNTVGNGDAMFGGDVYPENDNNKVLGTASKAWKNVYAYHYYTMTLASFVSRNVSKELLRFPPKTAGKATDGSAKLDISSLPAGLTDENGVLLNKMTTFNYQANYQQEVEIKALKEDIAQQKQEINDLKKIVEEQKVMINLLLGQQKK